MQRFGTIRTRVLLALVAGAFAVLAATAGGAAGGRGPNGALALPWSGVHSKVARLGFGAPSDAFCRSAVGVPCYSPQEIRHAYGVDVLLAHGGTGQGQSIVIIDSFGSPTIAHDLAEFDAGYGLPAPPSLQVLAPLGASPPFDPTNSDMVGWAFETSLDVEWAHAMAPAAKIVLLTSPVAETEGVQGMMEFLTLEQYALDHQLGQIVSQSWGATENTLFSPEGQHVFDSFESFYAQAIRQHVTVLASAGDTGSTNYELSGGLYGMPVVGFPGSSPLVTSVGGTSLYADTKGNYQSETVWNEGLDGGATGGGISQVFAEPDYQRGLPAASQRLLNGHRGLPDISWLADPFTPILAFISFLGQDARGYYFIGGTSEGAPALAGVVADMNQLLGRPIGFLNPLLYQLGSRGVGFHDITTGNNAFAGVPGYDAGPGWDAATGWGTPIAWQLFDAIASQGLRS